MAHPISRHKRIAPVLALGLALLGGVATGWLSCAAAQAPLGGGDGTRRVHDPCIIREGESYYVYSTGPGIPIRRSRDLVHWEPVGRVFPERLPAWNGEAVPGSRGAWAPDIRRFKGRYYLYYSVSTFGKNRSAIGLATNATLDPANPQYAWKDEGQVFASGPGDDYNAIDSNVLDLGDGKLALLFGSFWSGIKLVEADAETGKPKPGAAVRSLARRPSPDAIEAPFLVRHGGDYYLFASFDQCCRGVDSTYNIRVGRSKRPEGPYVDREGRRMLDGGGTLVLGTEGSVIGPGHCAVLQEPGRDLLAHHFYDGTAGGTATLQVRPLTWDNDGWPKAGPPLK